MSSPQPPQDPATPDDGEEQVPPASPAYSTPRPEGIPSADNDD